MNNFRNTLQASYILQQADLIRMQTQLMWEATVSEEEIKEMSQLQEMLSNIKSLLDTFARIHNQSK